MDEMDDRVRNHIRHLYFVGRMSPGRIASALTLSRRAVRRALIVLGGLTVTGDSAPTPTAVAVDPALSPPMTQLPRCWCTYCRAAGSAR